MVSKSKIDEEFIADIYCYDKHKMDINVKDLLKNGKREIIELREVNPFEVIVLPSNRLIFADTINKCFTILNQNFNLIKKIDRINDERFDPTGVALNQKEGKIYISDHHNHQVLMTDLELNFIKSIGSRGNGDNEFKYPRGMCFKKDFLYVCDYLNSRIQIFNKDLEYYKSLKVDICPTQVKASNTLLCLKSDPLNIEYFYDLEDLSFIRKIDNCTGTILSEINSSLYLYNDFSEKKVCCFNSNGVIDDEIRLNQIDTSYTVSYSDGCLIEFNGSLLMTLKSAKRLIRFSN